MVLEGPIRIVSVFHLKKRRFPTNLRDPLYRYFRWLITYYRVSGDDFGKYVIAQLTWRSL